MNIEGAAGNASFSAGDCAAAPIDGPQTVLVMDDEMALDVAQKLLEFIGCDVVLAKKCEEAIDIFTRTQKEGKKLTFLPLT